jgi:hypothetical protein
MGSPNFSGQIEADETFIGGKARNMHKAKRERVITGTGGKGNTAVMGIFERGGKLRTKVVGKYEEKDSAIGNPQTRSRRFRPVHRRASNPTKGWKNFIMKWLTTRQSTFGGEVHTNGPENFWSLVKRGLNGTYISVEPFHLFRCLDGQAFRYNNRKMNDAGRLDLAVRNIVGKRVTYEQLTGKCAAEEKTRP